MHAGDMYDPVLGNDVLPLETNSPAPRPSRFRLVVYSLLMLLILLVSSLLSTATALPSLLGYWHSHYQVRIVGIEAGDCGARSPNGVIVSDEVYCVCGVLDAGEDTADFSLNLHRESGQRVGVIHLREQPSGHFCHVFHLDRRLAIGEYEVRVVPRLSRQVVYGIRFSVEDPNPTI